MYLQSCENSERWDNYISEMQQIFEDVKIGETELKLTNLTNQISRILSYCSPSYKLSPEDLGTLYVAMDHLFKVRHDKKERESFCRALKLVRENDLETVISCFSQLSKQMKVDIFGGIIAKFMQNNRTEAVPAFVKKMTTEDARIFLIIFVETLFMKEEFAVAVTLVRALPDQHLRQELLFKCACCFMDRGRVQEVFDLVPQIEEEDKDRYLVLLTLLLCDWGFYSEAVRMALQITDLQKKCEARRDIEGSFDVREEDKKALFASLVNATDGAPFLTFEPQVQGLDIESLLNTHRPLNAHAEMPY